MSSTAELTSSTFPSVAAVAASPALNPGIDPSVFSGVSSSLPARVTLLGEERPRGDIPQQTEAVVERIEELTHTLMTQAREQNEQIKHLTESNAEDARRVEDFNAKAEILESSVEAIERRSRVAESNCKCLSKLIVILAAVTIGAAATILLKVYNKI